MKLQDLVDRATDNGCNQNALSYDLIWENVSECAEHCACCMETSNVHIDINDGTIWIRNGEDK